MGKTLLMLALAVASLDATAGWVKLASGGDDADTYYADPATIRKAGNKVRMWSLVEHQKAIADSFGKSHLSDRVQQEYDCKEEKKRILAYAAFPENQGQGKPVYSDPDPGKWEPVARGTVVEVMWKLACGKK